MVEESKSVESEEVTDGKTEEPAKKSAGRPRKVAAKPEPQPEPEPAADESGSDESDSDEQPKDTATEDGEKEPAAQEKYAAPEGRIIPEGEEVKIETREENGVEVAAETVYRVRQFPNSKRQTYILVATEGTKIQ